MGPSIFALGQVEVGAIRLGLVHMGQSVSLAGGGKGPQLGNFYGN